MTFIINGLLFGVVVFTLLFFVQYFAAKKRQEIVSAMGPEEREALIFGSRNTNLICPHCQTKGVVHAKRVARIVTSTGKVGGILKAATTSTTTTEVTQHHCAHCSSTWDI